MSRRKVVGLVLLMFAIALTTGEALAAGGSAPPPEGLSLVTTKTISAALVIDPHLGLSADCSGPFGCEVVPGVTSTGQQAAIVLKGKKAAATALFNVPSGGSFGFFAGGCDLSLTDTRVLSDEDTYRPMSDFIPQAVLDLIFAQIGVTIGTDLRPAITEVSAHCAPAPAGDSGEDVPNPGFLVLEANIGFWAGADATVPK